MECYILNNGIQMPKLILGVPMICEASYVTEDLFIETVKNAFSLGILGLDTSHDYGMSEPLLGKLLPNLFKKGIVERSSVFINTKIGNQQQIEGNIEAEVDAALKRLNVDYIDSMLLHWPVPGVYVKNWEKLIKVYEKGKVRSIGIANAKVRHLEKLKSAGLMMPQILQTEIHPLNTCDEEVAYCRENNILLQACTSLCSMIPLIKGNSCLQAIASEHGVTLPQVVLRWHLQKGIAPVFRSFNRKHLEQMADVFSFALNDEDMSKINNQNIDFRYHPESINCPGF